MHTQSKRLIDMLDCDIEHIFRKVVREELDHGNQKKSLVNSKEFIGIKEAALLINYSVGSIYRKVEANEIPFERIGVKKLAFRPADLIEWVIKNRKKRYKLKL